MYGAIFLSSLILSVRKYSYIWQRSFLFIKLLDITEKLENITKENITWINLYWRLIPFHSSFYVLCSCWLFLTEFWPSCLCNMEFWVVAVIVVSWVSLPTFPGGGGVVALELASSASLYIRWDETCLWVYKHRGRLLGLPTQSTYISKRCIRTWWSGWPVVYDSDSILGWNPRMEFYGSLPQEEGDQICDGQLMGWTVAHTAGCLSNIRFSLLADKSLFSSQPSS